MLESRKLNPERQEGAASKEQGRAFLAKVTGHPKAWGVRVWTERLSVYGCQMPFQSGLCHSVPRGVFLKCISGSSHCSSVVTNPTNIHEDMDSIPALTQWVKGSSVDMSCGVGPRCSSDPALLWLWLWRRLAAAALIQPLAWEPPYAVGVALNKTKQKTCKSDQAVPYTASNILRIK